MNNIYVAQRVLIDVQTDCARQVGRGSAALALPTAVAIRMRVYYNSVIYTKRNSFIFRETSIPRDTQMDNMKIITLMNGLNLLFYIIYCFFWRTDYLIHIIIV